MSSLSMIKKLAGESVVYGLSGIISRFIGVFLIPIYTRVFIPADYGIISLITSSFTLVSILMILGMDNSLHRWYYEDEDEEDRKKSLNTFLWSCFIIALAFTSLIAVFHNFFAIRILREPEAAQVVLVAALNLPLTVFIAFTGNVLRIQRRAIYTSVFTLTTSLLTILLNVLFVVLLKVGVIGIFYAQIITSFIAVVWTIILFRDKISLRYFDWQRWKEMFRFSFPLIPGGIAFWVINLSGVYFIQSFSNTREVGLYQIGTAIASAMAMLTGAFQMAWGPFALSIHKQSDAKQVYALTLSIYLGITSFIAVLITLFSFEILNVLTTQNYLDAYLVAGILAFNYLVIGLSFIAIIGTNIAKNNKAYGIASLVSAGLLIILNLILVPVYGKEGAAISTLASQIIIPIAIFWHSQKLYPIPYNFGKAALIFISGLIASFGVLSLTKEASFGFYQSIAVKITASVVYLALLFLILKPEIYSSKNIVDEISKSEA
jgi:O-antigen/teichoic acid export membrane protein